MPAVVKSPHLEETRRENLEHLHAVANAASHLGRSLNMLGVENTPEIVITDRDDWHRLLHAMRPEMIGDSLCLARDNPKITNSLTSIRIYNTTIVFRPT